MRKFYNLGADLEWFYETPQVGKLSKNVIRGYIYCFESWKYLPLVELNTYGHILVVFFMCMYLQIFSVK